MALDARKIVLTPDAAAASPGGAAITGMRLGFRALSLVAPEAAARLAAQLWFRPPRPRIRPELRAFMATGKRSSIEVNGRPVALWTWGSGPPVVLMHGWGGFGAQMQPFVEPFTRAGHQVLIFDAPAHGASGPSQLGSRRSTLFDFADVLHTLGRMHGELAGVIAHSGGGTAAAWSLLTAEWRTPAMVLIAPMASPIAYKNMFHSALGLSAKVLDRFDRYTEARFGFRWEELEVPEMASRMTPPPVLVVHDREDVETSWNEGAAIADTWPGASLHTTTGLGHRRVLRDPGVVEAVVDFVVSKGVRRPADPRPGEERA